MSDFKGMKDVIRLLDERRVIYPLTDLKGNLTGAAGYSLLPGKSRFSVFGTGVFGNVKTESNTLIITESMQVVLDAQKKKCDFVLGVINADCLTSDLILNQLAETKKDVVLVFDNDGFGEKKSKMIADTMTVRGIRVSVFHNKAGATADSVLSVVRRIQDRKAKEAQSEKCKSAL